MNKSNKENKYRVAWKTEGGAINKGLWETWADVTLSWSFLISKDRTAWIEDVDGNKVEEAPHV